MTQKPVDLIQAQLDAYNARDLDAFMAVYARGVEVFGFATGETLMSGHDTMRENYRKLFAASPGLHCEMKSRMALGNFVIDQEYVTGQLNSPPLNAIVIYEVRDGLIRRVWFIY